MARRARTGRAATLLGMATILAISTAMASSLAVLVTPSGAAAATAGPCPTANGVTVVIDFQELGGGVQVRCAPGSPRSGLDALAAAGINTQVMGSGFVCKISGRPENEKCLSTPPTTAYWSYWIAERGGAWCYSSTGAGSRTPPKGTVEGWSFSLNRSPSNAPSPRSSTFAAVSGASKLSRSDCPGYTSPAPTTVPPRRPAPRVAPAPAPAAGGGAKGATPAAPAPAAPAPGGSATAKAAPAAPTTAAPASVPGPAVTTTSEPVDGATGADDPSADDAGSGDDAADSDTSSDADDVTAASAEESGPDSEEIAVDLASSGDDGGPAALGPLLTLAAIAIVGGGAFVANRRRTTVRAGPNSES